jgi:hypothetical protein
MEHLKSRQFAVKDRPDHDGAKVVRKTVALEGKRSGRKDLGGGRHG